MMNYEGITCVDELGESPQVEREADPLFSKKIIPFEGGIELLTSQSMRSDLNDISH